MQEKSMEGIQRADVPMPTGEEALKRLMDGSKRYAASSFKHPDQSAERRVELKHGQHPFAVVLGCSDSRVPPEVLFDQGLGDIFTVRVAGNVLDDIVLASIEYAGLHLSVPLVMVLGHSNCGAVDATIQGQELEGHLPALTSVIQPVLDEVEESEGDFADNVIRKNALMVAEQIREKADGFNALIASGQLIVVAAYYDMDTGVVEILE